MLENQVQQLIFAYFDKWNNCESNFHNIYKDYVCKFNKFLSAWVALCGDTTEL